MMVKTIVDAKYSKWDASEFIPMVGRLGLK